MDNAIIVGLIIGFGGTVLELFRRSTVRPSKLMEAYKKDDIARFRKLLKKRKINVNLHGEYGNRPLHIAAGAWKKHMMIPELLKKGAFIDVRNIHKQTPLYFAALHGNLEGIKLLVESGADLYAEDYQGSTPLSIAIKQKRKKTIKLLEKLEALHNQKNPDSGEI